MRQHHQLPQRVQTLLQIENFCINKIIRYFDDPNGYTHADARRAVSRYLYSQLYYAEMVRGKIVKIPQKIKDWMIILECEISTLPEEMK